MTAIRRPSSQTNARASLPQTPDVSTATGVKSVSEGKPEYFVRLFISALAAEPAQNARSLKVRWRKSVRAGRIPRKASSSRPGHKSDAIRPLPTASTQTQWLPGD